MNATLCPRAAALAGAIFLGALASPVIGASEEPSYAAATEWWPDQPKQWLAIGWPKCPDEFVVLWNGNIQANGYIRASSQLTDKENGQRIGSTGANLPQAHLLFAVGDTPEFGRWWDDDGALPQSLLDGYLPVVTTERQTPQGKVTLESFATRLDHKGADCRAGDRMDDRPVVLWTRIKLTPKTGARHKPTTLWLSLGELEFDFKKDQNTFKRPARAYAPLDKSLRPDWFRGDTALSKNGPYLMDGNAVRLILQGDLDWSYRKDMQPPRSSGKGWKDSAADNLLKDVVTVKLTEKNGFQAVVAYPAGYVTTATAAKVKAIDINRAKADTVQFWEHRASDAPAMRLKLPEPELAAMLKAGTIQLLTGLRQQNGSLLLATGVITYYWTGGWSTPLTETMEQLMYTGHFAEAEGLLDYFYGLQHTVQDADALGPAYRAMWDAGKMNDYLNETGHDLIWVTGHGALMKAASDYYLLTRDEAFLTRWLPRLLGGLEWIRVARNFSGGKYGFAGIMPPGRSTDSDAETQTAFADAYTYWGFARTVHLLKSINHPEASKWEHELADYRDRLHALMLSEIPKYGQWKDDAGNTHPFVPYILGVYDEPSMHPVPGLPAQQVVDHPSNEAAHTFVDSKLGFYPDTGPQTWGAVGILEPHDPIVDETLDFLSAGLKSAHRVPMMQHGITMLEPAYSWDIPIYFARNDKDKFLEGFYSCAVRCFHRKDLQPVEYHYRNHTYATWVTFTRSLRNMLVTESSDDGHSTLEVFRNAPSHWFEQQGEIRVDSAPTEFGAVSMSAQLHPDQKEIEIDVTSPTRNPPDEVLIHVPVPAGRHITRVTVNSQPCRACNGAIVHVPAPLPRQVAVIAVLN